MEYGNSFYYTFTTSGTYVYHCNYHRREMRGVVYVR
jgi:plastocyanin